MPITALVNGKEAATLSIADRAVLYGDSVFETIAVKNQTPLMLEEHLGRLEASAEAFKISYDKKSLLFEIKSLVRQSKVSCVLRVTVSRGEGGRGYKPSENMSGTRILSLHDVPKDLTALQTNGINIGLSAIKLSHQTALAGHKHSNRLEQVLASMDITDELDEVVMLDIDDHVVCGSKSNIFVLINDQWHTPRLHKAGIAGVMRSKIIEIMHANNIPLSESSLLEVDDLKKSQAIFVSNSLIGIWPVKKFMNQAVTSHTHCNALITLIEEAGCVL